MTIGHRISIWTLAFLLPLAGWSSHIVGGEIYYDVVSKSNHLYKVTLHLYVDCINGTDRAIQNLEKINLFVYDAKTMQRTHQFEIYKTGPKKIDKLNYNCVSNPPEVCVDKYTYYTVQPIDPGEMER